MCPGKAQRIKKKGKPLFLKNLIDSKKPVIKSIQDTQKSSPNIDSQKTPSNKDSQKASPDKGNQKTSSKKDSQKAPPSKDSQKASPDKDKQQISSTPIMGFDNLFHFLFTHRIHAVNLASIGRPHIVLFHPA